MTTADEARADDALSRYYAEQVNEERRKVLDAVNEIALINEALSPLEKRKRELTEQVKQYMGLEGLGELADGETGAAARIQERDGTPLYDLVNAVIQHPEAVIAAGNAGMLRLDHQSLKRFRDGSGASWADALHGYEMPGRGTTALLVAKGNDRG